MKKKNRHHPQKAYKNARFLNSADARAVRILAEYLEPLQRLRRYRVKDTIVFFGSARAAPKDVAEGRYKRAKEKLASQSQDSQARLQELKQAERLLKMSKYYEEARALAYRLTEWSKSLEENQRFVVCSGGGPGIMEAANRGAMEAGGPTIGMNISIPFEQEPNRFITHGLDFEFHYFFMRKLWFVYLAKALVIFPGGFGTMDELFEIVTLLQTRKVRKPVPILIYGEEFWKEVFHIDKLLEYGTVSEDDLDLITFRSSVDEAFAFLKTELTNRFLKEKRRKYWYM